MHGRVCLSDHHKNLDDPSNPIREWNNSPIKGDNPNFKDWISGALKILKLTENRDDIFSKVLSQHFKLVDELGKFRNKAGTLSHGKEGFAHKLSFHHHRAAVLAADALIAFLHESYLEREPDPVTTFEPYESFATSNSIINSHTTMKASINDGLLDVELHLPGGEIFPLTVEPAQLLFGVDREGFKFALTACQNALPIDEGPEGAQ